ncbi:hypothetical protein [Halopseudomonas laoshanensis]|uniref:hypothetical protein n=1 Tax=Halopseudomonas laoshanensis TaxID=2268758 RepID=UPI0037361A8F
MSAVTILGPVGGSGIELPYFSSTVSAGFPSPALFPCLMSYQYAMFSQKFILEHEVTLLYFDALFWNGIDNCQ